MEKLEKKLAALDSRRASLPFPMIDGSRLMRPEDQTRGTRDQSVLYDVTTRL